MIQSDTIDSNTSWFSNYFKICGLCWFVCCPPLPHYAVKKIAFHPPPKERSYKIKLKNDPCLVVSNAQQALNSEFEIIPTKASQETLADYRHPTKTFVVRTQFNNYVIGVKCSPPSYNTATRNKVILFAQPNSSDLWGYLHPNGVSLTKMAELFQVDVYGFDYSGYGCSSGEPSEQGIYADIQAIYEFILTDEPHKEVILLGYSIGTAAVVDLASKNPSKLTGAILVAPLTSAFRLVRNTPFKVGTFGFDCFNNYEKIKNADVPILICHGTNDLLIASSHGEALHSLLRHPVPPLLLYGADHRTILSGIHIQVFKRIIQFIRMETKNALAIVEQPTVESLNDL